MKTPILTKPSEFYRTTIARGIATKEEKAIDPKGGKYGAGLIRGFSMIARGEALGHGMWIDGEMLRQVADATRLSGEVSNGIKARFTHPSLSGDGLGKMTARVFSAEVDGDLVRADAHFLESAHDTPDGDLAGYVMELAAEDPAAFGASISFRRDWEAEDAFYEANQVEIDAVDVYGKPVKQKVFKSPDPLNTENLPHVRLKTLRAVDFVDSPAANPSGLFHTGIFELLEGGESVLDYLFGVKAEAPAEVDLGVDLSRAKGFAARWAADRGFSIRKDSDMSVATPAPAAPVIVAEDGTKKTADLTSTQPPPAAAPQSPAAPAPSAPAPEALAATAVETPTPAATPANLTATPAPAAPAPVVALVDPAAEFRAGLKKFTDTFGFDNGAKWYQEGKSFEDAKDEHIKVLTAANKGKDARLAAATTGLGEDAPLSGTKTEVDAKPNRLELACGPNLAKYAAAIENQAARLQPSKN